MKSSLLFCLFAISVATAVAVEPPMIKMSEKDEPMQTGKFAPTWKSLKQYQTPEWFRDAKFGIWAHWGP